MNAPPRPTLSPTNSFSGSPPPGSLFDSAPLPPIDKRLSEAAMAKLAVLTEFPTNVNLDEIKISLYMGDPELCRALREIDSEIFTYIRSKSIKDNALEFILRHCPLLQSLDLFGFHRITQAALTRIAQLPHLGTLNLSKTQVRNLGPLIANPMPGLRAVNFSDTPIDHESLIHFLESHPNCHLTLSNRLPTGVFASSPSTPITLHWDRAEIDQIVSFLKEAHFCKNLEIITDTIPVDKAIELIALGNEYGKDVSVITPRGKFSYTSNFMS